jgi:hypothetical protein
VRIIGGRVSVHGTIEHVAAAIEDRLRAVAMMRVEIDDGDTLELATQHLGGNGGIVEIAEARAAVGIGVVPRRAT